MKNAYEKLAGDSNGVNSFISLNVEKNLLEFLCQECDILYLVFVYVFQMSPL